MPYYKHPVKSHKINCLFKVYDGFREVRKHDVEALYEAIKEHHKDAPSNKLPFIQHSSLVPVLRPYQSQAVKWMLCRESVTDTTSHGKYFEIIKLFSKTSFVYSNEYALNCD
jgi:hypothetical protein